MLKELASHVQCFSLTPAEAVRSSLRRAATGEGAEAHDLQPGEVHGACRRRRWRWCARSAVRHRCDVFLGAWRRRRRRGGLRLYQLRAACGATGLLIGIWPGLWVSASRVPRKALLCSYGRFLILEPRKEGRGNRKTAVEQVSEINIAV